MAIKKKSSGTTETIILKGEKKQCAIKEPVGCALFMTLAVSGN